MTARNRINTALTRTGSICTRPFTHRAGGASAGGQNVNGGTHEGGHRPYAVT